MVKARVEIMLKVIARKRRHASYRERVFLFFLSTTVQALLSVLLPHRSLLTVLSIVVLIDTLTSCLLRSEENTTITINTTTV